MRASHPPLCSRCLGDLDRLEYDAIVGRAITAVSFGVIGPLAAIAICNFLNSVGQITAFRYPPYVAYIIQERGIPLIPLAAYVWASIPYGWLVGRTWIHPRWLGPPQRSGTPSIVAAAVIIAPFLGPLGFARDVQRWQDLRRMRRDETVVRTSSNALKLKRAQRPLRNAPKQISSQISPEADDENT